MAETQLTGDEVRRIARLSRLSLTDEQVEVYRGQLSSILASMERLKGLDLSGVEPLTHVSEATNRLADDAPSETLSTETLMKMAPSTRPPFLKVPKVLGEGGGA